MSGCSTDACPTRSRYYGQLVKSRTVAAIVSAEFPIRFSRNITVGPILGVGFVPYLHGVIHYPGVPNEPSVDVTRSATGAVFSVGLALRWRGLVVEQFVHTIAWDPLPTQWNETLR